MVGYSVPINDARYFDPVTGAGVNLAAGVVSRLTIHECGVLRKDARWDYAGVCSPFWRAYHNLQAGDAVKVGGRRWELGPDRVLLLPEDLVFDCVHRAGGGHLWIHFSVDDPGVQAPAAFPRHVVLTPPEEALWRDLHVSAAEAVSDRLALLRTRCAGLLLLAWSQGESPIGEEGNPRLREFLGWLERRMDAPPSVNEMARVCGREPRTFLRWFAREMGRTPADYFRERRVREACRRLRFTDESIDTIATATGFAHRHHFSRVFRALTGRTPAHFRKGEKVPQTAIANRAGNKRVYSQPSPRKKGKP